MPEKATTTLAIVQNKLEMEQKAQIVQIMKILLPHKKVHGPPCLKPQCH